jgi:3-mercaptopyruvate sulfurtransferase SseA
MDVDSSYVLFVDNNNKNESAKLKFFAAMNHQSVGILGGKVEEYTCEGEGTEDTASPNPLSEEPRLPRPATGSSEQREGGTIGDQGYGLTNHPVEWTIPPSDSNRKF